MRNPWSWLSVLVASGCLTFIVVDGLRAAQPLQGNRLLAALPALEDLPGFANYQSGAMSCAKYSGSGAMAKRVDDGLELRVTVQHFVNPEDANKVPELHNRAVQVSAGWLRRHEIAGSRRGSAVWTNYAPSMGGFKLIMVDGASVVEIDPSPGTVPDRRGIRGRVQQRASEKDLHLAESIAISTMDRLTALGLTSRPAAEAPAIARAQIQKRLKVQEQ